MWARGDMKIQIPHKLGLTRSLVGVAGEEPRLRRQQKKDAPLGRLERGGGGDDGGCARS